MDRPHWAATGDLCAWARVASGKGIPGLDAPGDTVVLAEDHNTAVGEKVRRCNGILS